MQGHGVRHRTEEKSTHWTIPVRAENDQIGSAHAAPRTSCNRLYCGWRA